MSLKPVIMWFRQDLRIADNPALNHAAESGKPVLPVFVYDDQSPDVRPYGAAQDWWLYHSLQSLSQHLDIMKLNLILRRGPGEDVIRNLVEEVDADAICWNRRYGKGEQAIDASLKAWANETTIEARSFGGMLLHEPTMARTQSGNPYKVYTPFWKNFVANDPVRKPLPAPDGMTMAGGNIESDVLEDWDLLPTKPDWAGGIADEWTPGEAGAEKCLEQFLSKNLQDYNMMRDQPGPDRTSKMSPHLRFGEVSPYQLWHACYDQRHTAGPKAREVWAKELVWREFSYHLLHHWPDLNEANFQEKFDGFPWKTDKEALKAWQKGQTGYPIVDAGMRQLWKTGWMHNRVRMIVASFLVKHLLIDWREGEKWFWDTLVDGDPASNPAQWQWVAGSGADAAPYFRIFNPMLQGEKFDKNGQYIREYVPELTELPDKYIHTPWEAPEEILEDAGVTLGDNYPHPIVNHQEARKRALAALGATRPSTAD